MPKAELVPAYLWDCNECGVENVQRCVTVYLDRNDEDDLRMIADMHFDGDLDEARNAPESREFSTQTMPVKVKCKNCGKQFEATDPQCGDDE